MASFGDLQRPDLAGRGLPTLPLNVAAVRTFDTPEFAGMTFLEVEAKSALNKVKGMMFPWSINPYRGCSHACAWCFARPTHAYLNLSPLDDFEKTIVVKTNVVEVLRRELAKPSWKGEHVAMGTNTDPYQRCEGRYKLMPGIVTALAESLTPFSILTKGTLIQRDIEVLQAAAEKVPVTAAMSIGTIDDELWRTSEPGTPSPAARLSCVKALNAAGIPTGVMLAAIMPGLSDDPERVTELVVRAVQAGATHITPIVLHLRPGVREVFWPWLEANHPHLVDRYHALYRTSEAAAEYRDGVTAFVEEQREVAWRRYGRPAPPPWVGSRRQGQRPQRAEGQNPADGAEQLTFTL